jgi:hypothetical protein
MDEEDEEDEKENTARRPSFTAWAWMNSSSVRLNMWQKWQEREREPLLEGGVI